MLVYEEHNLIKVYYDEEEDLLIHKWFHYDPGEGDKKTLEVLETLYRIFLQYPTEKIIVNTLNASGAFTPTMQKFIAEVQFPRLLNNTPLRYIATIQSPDMIKQIASFVWQTKFKEGARVILHDVASEEEARAWFQAIEELKKQEASSGE